MPIATKNINAEKIQGNLSINSITATTISATTYQNLPTDVNVTGGTYSAGTITFTNNTGGTFNVTGLTTGSTSTISGEYLPLSGGTVTGETIFQSGLTANTISADTLTVTNNIYSSLRSLYNNSNNVTVDWQNGILQGYGPILDWGQGLIKDTGPNLSIDWLNRYLSDGNDINSIEWNDRSLRDSFSGLSMNWDLRRIYGSSGSTSISYGDRRLIKSNGSNSFDWENGILTGQTNIESSTISATTYQNLPTDIRVTGGTFSAGTITITNNTGGTFSVTGITNSSGPFGISDSVGTYTYYSTLSQAMSAATTGQVIEMFADVTNTTGTPVVLKPNITIQGNGHTYTHTSTTGDTFTLTTTGTYRFMNMVIKRTVTTPTGAFIFNNVGATFYQNYTMIFQNTSVEYTWTTSTGATPFIAPSTNVCFYYIDGIRALANGSGIMFAGNLAYVQTIKNSVIENTGTGSCFSSDNITGGSYIENSHLKTNSGNVVTFNYFGQGDAIRNSTVITTSGIGVAGGYAYDTSSFSNTNRAFSSVVCYMCAGSTGSGTVYYASTAWNSTGVSSTGYIVTPFFTLSSFYNCTLYAVTNIVAYDTTYSAAFYNCVLTTSYNNVAGHAISLAGAGNVLVNCYVTVANASANCFRGTSSITAKYTNNVFAGATTPVNANVTQSIVNTQDNQGNILI